MKQVFNTVFGALLVLLIGFAIWCGLIVRSVSTLRADLGENVQVLMAVEDAREAMETGELAPVATALELVKSRPELASRAEDARGALTALERGDVSAKDTLNQSLNGLTRAIRQDNATISGELGGYWDALYALVIASLLLLASNMGMLLWARDRHLRLEAIQARLVKLATSRVSDPPPFTTGSLSTTGEEIERAPTVLAEQSSDAPEL